MLSKKEKYKQINRNIDKKINKNKTINIKYNK